MALLGVPAAAQVDNSGTLNTTIALGDGGTLINRRTGVIRVGGSLGAPAVNIYGRSGTVTNSGLIAASGGEAVRLGAGGTINNDSTGTITSIRAAAYLYGPGSVTNNGTIQSQTNALQFAGTGVVINNAGASISGMRSGIYVPGGSIHVTNSGFISGTYGVYASGASDITNRLDGTISGQRFGVRVTGRSVATVRNEGTISASTGDAMDINAGTVVNVGLITGRDGGLIIRNQANVQNAAEGTIQITGFSRASSSGLAPALDLRGRDSTVVIDGRVAGPVAVNLRLGGTVTNNASGTIAGGAATVRVSGGAASVDNAGRIHAYSGRALYFGSGGYVINQMSGVIAGHSGGIRDNSTAAVTIRNDGSISSSYGSAIYIGTGSVTNSARLQGDVGITFRNGGDVTNLAGGQIHGGSIAIVSDRNRATVTNSGVIRGAQYSGIYLNAGGLVANQGASTGGGTIYGYSQGVMMIGAGTVLNHGRIEAAHGAVVNLGSGTVVNTGVITQVQSAYDAANGPSVYYPSGVGINIGSGSGTITNSGRIRATRGIVLGAGGRIDNAADGQIIGQSSGITAANEAVTISNAGTITASDGPGVAAGEASLANSGLIRGHGHGLRVSGGRVDNTGGTIEALGTTATADEAAVLFQGGVNGTLTNSGTLVSANGRALRFADMTGDVALVLDTGSSLQGTVDITGAMPTTSWLVLQGSGSEDLSRFTGFQNARVESNATWELTSGAGLAGFATLTNAGTLVPGSFSSPQTLRLEGSFIQMDTGLLRIGLRPGGVIGGLLINGAARLAGDVRFTGPVSGPLVAAGRLVFLQANGGVTGTFAQALNDLAYLEASLDYASDPNAVALVLSLPTPVTPPDDSGGAGENGDTGSGSSGDTPDPTPTDDNRVESETRPITDDEDGDSPAPETNPAPITNPTTGTNAGGAAKGGANRAPGPIDLQRVPFAAVAATPAQQAAGLALQQLAGEGPLEGFLGDLAGQTLAGARQSLGEVAAVGVARAGEAAVGLKVGRLLLGLPLRALRLEERGEGADPGLGVALLGGGAPMAGLAADVADVRAWAAGFGSTGAVGDAADAGVEFNAAGGAVGLDQRLGPGLRLGLGLGYARSDSQLQALPAGAATDTTALLAYGGWRAGRVHVRGALGYAHGRVDSHRTLSPSTSPSSSGSAPAQAEAGSHTNQLMSRAEAGVDLSLGALSLTPFAALEASQLWQGRTTEDGAAPLNLGLAGGSAASLRHILGAEARHSLTLAEGVEGTVDLRLGWARELHPYASRVSLAFAAAPDSGFQVNGPRPQQHAALVGLGLAVEGFQSLSGFARYDAELGHKDQSHSLSLGLRLVW